MAIVFHSHRFFSLLASTANVFSRFSCISLFVFLHPFFLGKRWKPFFLEWGIREERLKNEKVSSCKMNSSFVFLFSINIEICFDEIFVVFG